MRNRYKDTIRFGFEQESWLDNFVINYLGDNYKRFGLVYDDLLGTNFYTDINIKEKTVFVTIIVSEDYKKVIEVSYKDIIKEAKEHIVLIYSDPSVEEQGFGIDNREVKLITELVNKTYVTTCLFDSVGYMELYNIYYGVGETEDESILDMLVKMEQGIHVQN